MSLVGDSPGYALFLVRSKKDAGAVQREILQILATGEKSFRDLKRESVYWQSQIACALARQMKYGRVVRTDEGHYRRIN